MFYTKEDGTKKQIGKVTNNRFKKIRGKEIEEQKNKELESGLSDKDKTEMHEVLSEERTKNKKEFGTERDVYQDLHNKRVNEQTGKQLEEEHVKDDANQFVPRHVYRYISSLNLSHAGVKSTNDPQKVLKGLQEKGITAPESTGGSTELDHLRERYPGNTVSSTHETKNQIVGGGEDPTTFNSGGMVKIDLAQFNGALLDVSTRAGIVKMLQNAGYIKFDNDGKMIELKPIDRGVLQAMVDARRTREVVVGTGTNKSKIKNEHGKEEIIYSIPGNAVTEYHDKESVDKKISGKLTEKGDAVGNTFGKKGDKKKKADEISVEKAIEIAMSVEFQIDKI